MSVQLADTCLELAVMFNTALGGNNMTESNPTNLITPLQSERILRWPEVKHRIGYSRSHTHNLIAEGKFPAPIKLGGRASGWVESEISEWIESRIDISRREDSI